MPDFVMASLIFIPVLLYPPLLFIDKITAPLRIGLYIFLIGYLFFSAKRASRNDVVIFFLLLILSISFIVVNFSDPDGLRTAGSTLLTIMFAWAMGWAVETNERIRKILISFYINLFRLIPLCSVLSVISLITFGEFNLFDLHSEGNDYSFTPFGAAFIKDLSGVGVYRSFSFFQEPVYLASFYAANIFLIAPLLKKNSRSFLIVNVIGGLLTFSFLFFALSLLLFFCKKMAPFSSKSIFYLVLMMGLGLILSQIDLFSSSSLGDRLGRMNYFFMAMDDANAFQFMFGHGFAQKTGFDQGFSAGLFTAIYEIGVVNLMLIIFFVNALLKEKFYIFLIFFVSLLVFEPIKLPIFWVLVVVLNSSEHVRTNSLIKVRRVFKPVP